MSSLGEIHGSLMVAMEHSSGDVRARAVEQLARALSSAGATVDADGAVSGVFAVLALLSTASIHDVLGCCFFSSFFALG